SVVCALLGLGLLLVTSCGSGLSSVRGKVTYKGQPIKGAVVTFHPVGGDPLRATRPTGVTAEDGSYTLSCEKGTGAPPGQYVVTVVWMKDVEKKKGFSTDTQSEQIDQLQNRYADSTKSQIKFQIKSGNNNLDPIALE